MGFVPLLNRTHYSLGRSIIHPIDLIKKCAENDYAACSITDYNSLSGTVDFYKCAVDELKKLKGFENKKVKPIIGLDDGRNTYLAKNKNGWVRLIQNKYNEKNDDVVVITGYDNSVVSSLIFTNAFDAFKSRNLADVKNLIHPEHKLLTRRHLKSLIEQHGKENVVVGIQLLNSTVIVAEQIQSEILREIAKELELDAVAITNTHYLDKGDVEDYKIILCTDIDCRLDNLYQKMIESDDSNCRYLSNIFFDHNFHLPTLDELRDKYTLDEIENTQKVADKCEIFKLLNQPKLPKFDQNKDSKELLTQKCREGWKRRFGNTFKNEVYVERIKKELGVVNKTDVLADYFLIVADFINWAISQDILVGWGRGSGAGCLISYLLNIVNIEPLKYDLVFERFYNDGRNTADNISLPDIDSDFEIKRRSEVVEYIRNKYGHDKVAQIATFGRMQGRGALKDVLRAHNACTFDQMNKITDPIPDEAAISDQLEYMRKETGEASILQWSLENISDDLKEWCFLNEEGKLDGPYAKYFEQAIRLEGTKKSYGKHAAGIVISVEPLKDVCPMIKDKASDELICGLDMKGLEAIGLCKFDILGVAVLDKIKGTAKLVHQGFKIR